MTLAALVLAAGAVTAFAMFIFGGGPGGSTVSNSQSASAERNCFGLSGVAGRGDASATTAIASSSCGLISAEDLEGRVTSKADWYAAHSPKITVDGLAMGCELPRTDARMYLDALGETFTVATLREFRGACKG